jgi:hypothetical protein
VKELQKELFNSFRKSLRKNTRKVSERISIIAFKTTSDIASGTISAASEIE